MVQKNAILDVLGRGGLLKNISQTQTGTRWGWALWVVLEKMMGKVRTRSKVYSEISQSSPITVESSEFLQRKRSTQCKHEAEESLGWETGWSPCVALRSGHSLNFWESSCTAIQKIQNGAEIIPRDVGPVLALHSVKPISCTSTFCTEICLPLMRWDKQT